MLSSILRDKYMPLPHDLDGVHPGAALEQRGHVAAVLYVPHLGAATHRARHQKVLVHVEGGDRAGVRPQRVPVK